VKKKNTFKKKHQQNIDPLHELNRCEWSISCIYARVV